MQMQQKGWQSIGMIDDETISWQGTAELTFCTDVRHVQASQHITPDTCCHLSHHLHHWPCKVQKCGEERRGRVSPSPLAHVSTSAICFRPSLTGRGGGQRERKRMELEGGWQLARAPILRDDKNVSLVLSFLWGVCVCVSSQQTEGCMH